jgi:hypothetical protein
MISQILANKGHAAMIVPLYHLDNPTGFIWADEKENCKQRHSI